jgi:hypothetical protein
MLLKMPLGGPVWMVIGIGKPNSNQIQTWIGGLAQIQGLQNRILDSIAQIVPDSSTSTCCCLSLPTASPRRR